MQILQIYLLFHIFCKSKFEFVCTCKILKLFILYWWLKSFTDSFQRIYTKKSKQNMYAHNEYKKKVLAMFLYM